MKFKSIREECLEANLDLVSKGLVDMTFGNVSILDLESSVFAIKPSGVDYGDLKTEDIVVVNLAGDIVDGDLRPSSDTPTHRCLYLAFAHFGIRAVAHTHSRHAVAFAQAARPLNCLGTTHGDFFNGTVPVTRVMSAAQVQGDYEWETGKVIIEAFESIDPTEIPAALVHCHGPFAWGVSGAKAVEHAFALEVIAQMAINTFILNPNTEGVTPHLLNKHFFRKHGETAYYGQNDDGQNDDGQNDET